MDRRGNVPHESAFIKDLKADSALHDETVEFEGKSFRIPFRFLKEIVFSDIDQAELKDIEHSARLQYRLLLLDPVLRAKVEFTKRRITVTYNPPEATNRKEKISKAKIIEFLAKEGVKVDEKEVSERAVDYFEEIYKAQFKPAVIREHAPYGYTLDEWKSMKPAWEKKQQTAVKAKYKKFKEWQDSYLAQHEELAKEFGYVAKASEADSEESKKEGTEKEGKERKNEGEKGFWFYGM